MEQLLIIEDSASDIFLLRRMLGEEFLITSVPLVTDAFDHLQRKKIALILLDMNLLDMDGLEAISSLRSAVPAIPLIVYSGMDSSKVKKAAISRGAHDYIAKDSADRSTLLTAIKRAILSGRASISA